MIKTDIERLLSKWMFGERDAFSDFKHFSKSVRTEKYHLYSQDYYLELSEFKDQEVKVYVIANDYITLFATQNEEVAQSVFNDYVTFYKKIEKGDF